MEHPDRLILDWILAVAVDPVRYERDSEESMRAIANQINYCLNVPLQEHYETLRQLGLPAPVIEPDYEVFDVADSDKENNS